METVTKIVYGDKYLPDLVKLVPAVMCPALENCEKVTLSVSSTKSVSTVQTQPVSALVVPPLTNTKVPGNSLGFVEESISAALAQGDAQT